MRSAGCAGIELLCDGSKVLAAGPQLSLVFGILGIGNLRAEFSKCIRQQIAKLKCLFVIKSQFHVNSPRHGRGLIAEASWPSPASDLAEYGSKHRLHEVDPTQQDIVDGEHSRYLVVF